MNKNNIRKVLLSGALIIIGLAAYLYYSAPINKKSDVSVKPAAQTLEDNVIEIGLTTGGEDNLFLLDYAEDNGFFVKNHLKVKRFFADSDLSKALISGAGDIALTGPSRAVLAYFNGADVKLVANLFRPFAYFGMSRFPREQSGLIKKILVNSLSGENRLVGYNALKNIGLDPDKIDFIAVPGNAPREAMLAKNEADFVTINSEIFLNKIEARKKYTVYEPEEILKDSGLIVGIIVMQKTIDQKPEEIKGALSAFHSAIREMSENPEKVISYSEKKYSLSRERAENLYNRFVLAQKGVDYIPNVNSLSAYIKVAENELGLDETKSRDINGMIYSDFSKEAADNR